MRIDWVAVTACQNLSKTVIHQLSRRLGKRIERFGIDEIAQWIPEESSSQIQISQRSAFAIPWASQREFFRERRSPLNASCIRLFAGQEHRGIGAESLNENIEAMGGPNFSFSPNFYSNNPWDSPWSLVADSNGDLLVAQASNRISGLDTAPKQAYAP
jgi:hypothetical protein